ncbi:hypothetical protein KJ953_00360 [Patescibacteria group bacterium]|nr:hypothetical protein [Patescibacteria group bacterium]MBU1256133.1 hypothetical protein [Patescibacteria group bacterium]MBU1457890.1 hypothetical protein [Patescibacteria group bacterium]
MKQNTLRFLPLIIILFSVVGVLSWYAKNQPTTEKIKPEVISPANLQSENLILSPTPSSFFFSDEPVNESTAIPSTSEVEDSNTTTTLPAQVLPEQKLGVATICTPVYGMADTCTEHIVVDTGAESAVAYSLSGITYLAGLLAFVKSKKA